MKRHSRSQFLSSIPLLVTMFLNSTAIESFGQVSVDGGPNVDEAVLFSFDDHAIPWRDNVAVTPVTAEKHAANPVLRRGPQGAPDHGHAILYGSVLHIGGKFRMWYLGMFETEVKSGQAPGWWRPMCYAESDDGVTWTNNNWFAIMAEKDGESYWDFEMVDFDFDSAVSSLENIVQQYDSGELKLQ